MGRKLTDEQVKEVCRLYENENILSPKIGKMFNVGANTIRKYLNDNNIKIKRIEINPGDQFGRWIIVEEVDRIKGQRCFLCECSCTDKTRRVVGIGALRNGNSQSCGCLSREKAKERKLNTGVDYTGQTFGRLTVLYEVERAKNGHRRVMCRCSCDGNIRKYNLISIRIGATTSCGCFQKESVKENRTNQKKNFQEKYPLFCEVEEIRDRIDEPEIEVKCKKCNEWFFPTKGQLGSRLWAIEKPNIKYPGIENHFYCSEDCKNSCILYNLKSDPYETKKDNIPTQNELNIWANEVLKQQLERENVEHNFCEVCGDRNKLNSHHVVPKKIEPIYALDPDNGIVACVECHDKFHKGECSTGALAYKVCK